MLKYKNSKVNKNQIYIGKSEANFKESKVNGEIVKIDHENFYKIANSDQMRTFFMSLVSESNHWMFVSSNGGISAGRKNADKALFPYYTEDKIKESAEITGSKTLFLIHKADKSFLWEAFSSKYEGVYNITRNLYKNAYGNKVIFEEINQDLGLSFRYQWNTSNKFGFVKKSSLINSRDEDIQITVLDGLQNILPYGVGADLQNSFSNLVDAYKKNELEGDLGIFTLSAIIVDKPEPSEALKANIAWSVGLEKPKYLISSKQLDRFRTGESIQQEKDIKAEKGAYFVVSDINIQANREKNWLIVANVNQGPSDIVTVLDSLKSKKNLYKEVEEDIELGTQNLLQLIASADGLQLTADQLENTRHFSNVLFNCMRGGIFDDNYKIEAADFIAYIKKANKYSYQRQKNLLDKLPETTSIKGLRILAEHIEDANFKRLCLEYMPLKFSRRHGDPSRPWNRFSINTQNEIDGSKVLDYEGNWRDIFQNWEALAHSYPEFIESMIHKFLNATTFDGYNPYRVTKDGFDWEIIEPNDPWSFIGYWGDHQIIYLLKFLEFAENYYPNKLANLFATDLFVYANVPYKIKTYNEILRDPKDTIDFDHDLNHLIIQRKSELGADGALLTDQKGSIYRVNLIEKLLATVLAKVSNFIPEAGIWLNTQRPEWNDANNALVGNGVSMVTLYYLRRFMHFFEELLSNAKLSDVMVSVEMAKFFEDINSTLIKYQSILSGRISDKDRRAVLDGLGQAGSNYRTTIYENKFSSEKQKLSKDDLLSFTKITRKYLEHSIDANKRADKLYHAYNIMTIKKNQEIAISYLPEMLEGQVAVLSSAYLSSQESLEILNAMKSSALFREDQYTYILYPNKELKRFTAKNIIPKERVEDSKLFGQLLEDADLSIIEKDRNGNYHFNGNFNNANSLKQAISELPEKYKNLVDKENELLLAIFEEVFDHKSFTGRSGTFYGYEGLGSIYWHMVSKLLLAVQENCLKAVENKESDVLIGKLLDHYYEINAGIGVHKSPKLYGAFPTDPYSHTPEGKGAQQPGMTGQVKEDILSRFGELGVFVKEGKLQFNPRLLRPSEFLKEDAKFRYFDVDGISQSFEMKKDSLGFTYCQVPVVYKLSSMNRIKLICEGMPTKLIDALSLDKAYSNRVFSRSGEVKKIIVYFKK
jgi:hypothetical protein